MRPKWLPDEIAITYKWEVDFPIAYECFKNDFLRTHPIFGGLPVRCGYQTDENGFNEKFWHLIQREESGYPTRTPDYDRMRTLPWCRPLIENPDKPGVRCWRTLESDDDTHIYIWSIRNEYVVILKEFPRIKYQLITAFPVLYDKKFIDLCRKYRGRI